MFTVQRQIAQMLVFYSSGFGNTLFYGVLVTHVTCRILTIIITTNDA